MDRKPLIKRNGDKRNNKRWTDDEIKQLLQYLKEQPDFEKPTAQIFYRKFLKTSKLDASWNLCRWKIKHLRTTYKKAETWRRSNGLLENDPAVKDNLRKMCRFYDYLHCVFAQSISNYPDDIFDNTTTTNVSNNRTSMTESTMDDSNDEFYLAAVKSEEADVNEDQNSLLVPLHSATTSPVSSVHAESPNNKGDFYQTDKTAQQFVAQLNPMPVRNSLYEISHLQSEQSSFLHMRLEFDKEKFQKEFELKERQFAEECKERKDNFELKKLQMEKDERLRILELEKEERIERFQIEMRYRSRNE